MIRFITDAENEGYGLLSQTLCVPYKKEGVCHTTLHGMYTEMKMERKLTHGTKKRPSCDKLLFVAVFLS